MKKIIKSSFYLFCMACLLCSCRYNINNLDQQEIGFDSLPSIVQDTLITLSQPGCKNDPDFIFLDNKEDRYDTKMLKSGPFINGYNFEDNKNRKKYKINNGIPYPYIIYNGFLYHSLNYNIFYEPTIRNESFMKYTLK